MSLPSGFLDDLRTRLTLSDVVGRKVIWDRAKSNPSRGDFWAPCPFHQEKTPSFHVDDRKGFYYCFGCHAKGDLVSFVMETENVAFIEAVEVLAREAGVEMPAQTRDPKAAERRDRATRLADVMEQAVRAFRLAYVSGAGTGARDYVAGRGLTDETVATFEIGFAPDSRSHLTAAFREKGLLDEAVAAGLVIRPDDGGAPYDRFRNRLMFPIRDPRGRCIAFGGRAMDPGARAKYLNSPETELFHKGRTLYNHGPAREAAGKSGTLVVAEGYMDVIALAQAGFAHAVAPLGTAITEEQLALMWRIADEPVIALDGDAAGQRAAERLIDLALPHLAPGKSLRFCLLPDGRDPDDVIRVDGAASMSAHLEASASLFDYMWSVETKREIIDTPEKKASLNRRFKELLRKIPDPAVRKYYGEEIYNRWKSLFQPDRKAGSADIQYLSKSKNLKFGKSRATEAALASELAKPVSAQQIALTRQAAALLIGLMNQNAIECLEVALEEMRFDNIDFSIIRDRMTSVFSEDNELISKISNEFGYDVVMMLRKFPRAREHPYAKPGIPTKDVINSIEEIAIWLATERQYAQEISGVKTDLSQDCGEAGVRGLDEIIKRRYDLWRMSFLSEDETSEDFPWTHLLQDEGWRRRRGRSGDTRGKKT